MSKKYIVFGQQPPPAIAYNLSPTRFGPSWAIIKDSEQLQRLHTYTFLFVIDVTVLIVAHERAETCRS